MLEGTGRGVVPTLLGHPDGDFLVSSGVGATGALGGSLGGPAVCPRSVVSSPSMSPNTGFMENKYVSLELSPVTRYDWEAAGNNSWERAGAEDNPHVSKYRDAPGTAPQDNKMLESAASCTVNPITLGKSKVLAVRTTGFPSCPLPTADTEMV